MIVSGGSETETTISDLMPSTNYSIEVAAVNNAGTGEYSDTQTTIIDGMKMLIVRFDCVCFV